jgi:hypothetical protein
MTSEFDKYSANTNTRAVSHPCGNHIILLIYYSEPFLYYSCTQTYTSADFIKCYEKTPTTTSPYLTSNSSPNLIALIN